jgi:hypothetical protein
MEEAREKLQANVGYVDVKPFSHNIISIVLRRVAEVHGHDAANELIDEFDLEDLGWQKISGRDGK